jgi:hypothetical protein
MNLFQIIGSISGIVGTIILSTKLSSEKIWRFRVFLFYLISNISLIIFFVYLKQWYVLGMNLVYLLSTINGLRNNRN